MKVLEKLNTTIGKHSCLSFWNKEKQNLFVAKFLSSEVTLNESTRKIKKLIV